MNHLEYAAVCSSADKGTVFVNIKSYYWTEVLKIDSWRGVVVAQSTMTLGPELDNQALVIAYLRACSDGA
jgi:hypothetical protein